MELSDFIVSDRNTVCRQFYGFVEVFMGIHLKSIDYVDRERIIAAERK